MSSSNIVDKKIAHDDNDDNEDDKMNDYSNEEEDEEKEDERAKENSSKKGHKKHHKGKKENDTTYYFDLAASESSGEEEEEEEPDDNDIMNEEDKTKDRRELRQAEIEMEHRMERRRQKLVNSEDIDAEEYVRGLKERNDNVTYDEQEGSVEQTLHLPTIYDSRLFRVTTSKAKEAEALLQLFNKYVVLKGRGENLGIKAVFFNKYVNRKLYIEADREDSVLQAISGIDVFLSGKIEVIPINEMPQVVKSAIDESIRRTQSMQDVQKGSFVRLRRGLYRNDLAQVELYNMTSRTVLLRVVPRLDYDLIEQKMRMRVEGNDDDNSDKSENNDDFSDGRFGIDGGDEDDNGDNANPENKKKKRGQELRTKRPRPPQQYFDGERLRRMGCEVEVRSEANGMEYYIYKGNRYVNGFLLRYFSEEMVSTKNVNPEIYEIEKFDKRLGNVNMEDEDEGGRGGGKGGFQDPSALFAGLAKDTSGAVAELAKATTKNVKFERNDRVLVKEGDLIGLTGKVISVRGGDEGQVIIKLDKDQLKGIDIQHDELSYEPFSLSKLFYDGERVVITNGAQKGKSGLVVSHDTDKELAVVLLDGEADTIELATSSLTFSSYSTTGSDQSGRYVLFDFVRLDDGTQGCIVRFEGTTATLLLPLEETITSGIVESRTVKTTTAHIVSVERRSFQKAVDIHEHEISPKDSIRIISGKYKGFEGVVKHIVGSCLFVLTTKLLQNSGMVVCDAKETEYVSSPIKKGRVFESRQDGSKGMSGEDDDNNLSKGTGRIKNGRDMNDYDSKYMRNNNDNKYKYNDDYNDEYKDRRDGRYGDSSSSYRQSSYNNTYRERNRDPFLYHNVSITAGPFKGLCGMVKDSNRSTARVELQASCKTVTVSRKFLTLLDDTPPASLINTIPSQYNNNNNYGPQPTPLHPSYGGGMGGVPYTPLHPSMASSAPFTPLHPSAPQDYARATPMHPSMSGYDQSTPIHPSIAPPSSMYAPPTPIYGQGNSGGQDQYGRTPQMTPVHPGMAPPTPVRQSYQYDTSLPPAPSYPPPPPTMRPLHQLPLPPPPQSPLTPAYRGH